MMTPSSDDRSASQSSWDGEDPGIEDPDLEGEAVETTAEIECPHCGESISLNLDAGGGMSQDYVEDCQVCCRPCRIRLQYDEEGRAQVWVDLTR